MMKRFLSPFFALLGGFGTLAHAQILTDLSDYTDGYEIVDQDEGLAQPFTTGTNPGGYLLTSITLGMTFPSTADPSLTFSIDSTANGTVGTPTLNGTLPNPTLPLGGQHTSDVGTITWSPATGTLVTLEPSTQYWFSSPKLVTLIFMAGEPHRMQ